VDPELGEMLDEIELLRGSAVATSHTSDGTSSSQEPGAAKCDAAVTVTRLTEQLPLVQRSVTELTARAEAIGIVARSDSAADGRQTEIDGA
jgi:hypothetical protein